MTLEPNTPRLRRVFAHLGWSVPGASISKLVACTAFLLTAVYVWILPIGHTTALRNIVFFALALLTLWASWKQGLKLRFPIAWAWAIYVGVAVVSLPYALDPAYSLSEIKTELVYGMLAFALGATWIRNETSFNRLMVLLLTGNAFLVGYAIFQATVLLKDAPPNTLGSLHSGFGTFSTYLVTVLPFLVAYALLHFQPRWRRWIWYGLLTANLLAIYYTISRAAVLAVMAEIAIAATLLGAYYLRRLPRQRALAYVTLGIVAVIGLAALFNVQMERRVPTNMEANADAAVAQDPRITILWPAAIQNIRNSPLSGGGFGRNAFKLRNPDIGQMSPAFWHAHNMFLNRGVQMGLPGILAFVLLLSAVSWKIRPTADLVRRHQGAAMYAFAGIAMVAGVVVKNMTDDYFIRDNALMFWLLAGALIGILSGRSETAARSE